MREIIGVDLDNTLCVGKSWREDNAHEALEAEPIQEMIDAVNQLYKDNFIIIYTARQNFLMTNTFEWLDRHNVKYHAVSNNKIPVKKLIDDTAVNPQQFLDERRNGNEGK